MLARLITFSLSIVLLNGFAFYQETSETRKSETEWQDKIVGKWQIDRKETLKKWEKTWIGRSSESLLFMHAIAPEEYNFQKDGQLIIINADRPTYSDVNFDEVNNRVAIKLENQFGESQLVFEVLSDDKLLLHNSGSPFGPIKTFYNRVKTGDPDIVKGITTKLDGTWRLDLTLSETWREKKIKKEMKQYLQLQLKRLDQEIKEIRFENGKLTFNDESSELLRLQPSMDDPELSTIFTNAVDGSENFEITVFGPGVIKLVDTRRQFVGVYVNDDRISDEMKHAILSAEELFKDSKPSVLLNDFEFSQDIKQSTADPNNGIPTRSVDSVKIDAISIERKKAEGAHPNADLTNMEINLYFSTIEKGSHSGGYHIKFLNLEPVYDDTGKLLSTEKRRERIIPLKQFDQINQFNVDAIIVPMQLEAPARGAHKIRSLSGEAVVRICTLKMVEIKDLRSKVGKPIEHQLLKDVKITPTIEDRRYPEIKLGFVGDQSRIIDWYLTDAMGNQLEYSSLGRGEDFTSKGIASKLPKDFSLWLKVADEKALEKHKFNFKDIDFP